MADHWPFAHTYAEVLTIGCRACGRRRPCVRVLTDGERGNLWLCWVCLKADGDPLARLR